jgi:hypothetical protein
MQRRLAFTQAEGAIEEPSSAWPIWQAEHVTNDAEQALLSSLGQRLDDLWIRCLHSEGSHGRAMDQWKVGG